MSWIFWLGLAVGVSVVLSVTALKPKGTRPVAHTRLLAIARVILLIVVVILFFVWLQQRGH